MKSVFYSDECLSSMAYLNLVTDYAIKEDYSEDANISYDDFEELREKYAGDLCLWDYPLTEIEHVIENGLKVALVSFDTNGCGLLEFRLCEVPEFIKDAVSLDEWEDHVKDEFEEACVDKKPIARYEEYHMMLEKEVTEDEML